MNTLFESVRDIKSAENIDEILELIRSVNKIKSKFFGPEVVKKEEIESWVADFSNWCYRGIDSK